MYIVKWWNLLSNFHCTQRASILTMHAMGAFVSLYIVVVIMLLLWSCCHCFCHLYSCFQCTHFLQEGPHCGFSCIHLGLQSNSEFFSSSITTTTTAKVNLGSHSAEKPIGNWTRWPSENGFTVNLFKILFGKHFFTHDFLTQYCLTFTIYLWVDLSLVFLENLKHIGKLLHKKAWQEKLIWWSICDHLDKKKASCWRNPLPRMDSTVKEHHWVCVGNNTITITISITMTIKTTILWY